MNNTEGIVFDLPKNRSAAIKVIGVGGGGNNAVNHMFEEGISGVDFVICNTDAQALNNSPVSNKIQLGVSVTEGLGAGANPEVGKQAALESAEDIKAILDTHTKMVFITAGMGGGTGTGAAPIIAGMAKELGILTVGIVTVPFYFEGNRRMEQAEAGVEELKQNVDSLIVINNDKLRELYGNLGFKTGFAKADEVLAIAAKGIAEVITNHYKQNIDLRDAKTVLADSGTAIMGSAVASGVEKAKEAIINALDSPLLNNNKIKGAKNVLLLIVSGAEEITIDEIGVINDYIQTEAGYSANIIMGIGEDEELGNAIRVTVVATGFPHNEQKFSREEKKTVHTLLEEQPVIKVLSPDQAADQSEESIENPITEIVKPENRVEKKTRAQHIKQKNLFGESTSTERTSTEASFENRIVYPLFEEEENKTEKGKMTIEDSNIGLQETTDKTSPEISLSPNYEEKTLNNVKTNTDDFDDYDFEVKVIEKKEKKQEIDTEKDNYSNPFETPILERNAKKNSLKNTEERRKKLKAFNYKFKQQIKNIEDIERTPAYKRQGIELTELNKDSNLLSRRSLTQDEENKLKTRDNNSFLHDNTD